MPTPAIVDQMPKPDAPEMPYAYGQPYASGYPYLSEHTFSSGHLHPPEYPNVSGGTFGAPSYAPVPSELRVEAWVPSVPGLSDKADVDPMPSEPNVFEQAFDAPSQISEYHPSEPQTSAWVPSVPQSGEAEGDPTSEPICIYTPEDQEAGSVPQSPTISPKPSLLKRFASFLRITQS